MRIFTVGVRMKITEEQRISILRFLQWNDRNGCYLDRERKLEGYRIIRKREAIKMFVVVTNEDHLLKNNVDIYCCTYTQVLNLIKAGNRYFSTSLKMMLLLEKPEIKTFEKIIRL